MSDVVISGRHFKRTRGLWELLIRNYVTRGVVTADDLKQYKTIVQLTNAHLQGYEPGVTCKHRVDPSSGNLFQSCSPKRSGLSELSCHYTDTGRGTRMAGKVYFDSKHSSVFSTLKRLHAAARGRTAREQSLTRGTGSIHFTSFCSKEISTQSFPLE